MLPDARRGTETTDPARTVPDLSDAGWRAELTPAAIEAFINLTSLWRLTTRQAAALLHVSDAEWLTIRSGHYRDVLSEDALLRLSAIIGVFKGLHLLFSEPLANEWVRLPNTEALYGGAAPIDVMIKGGASAIRETRNYLDALRGGL